MKKTISTISISFLLFLFGSVLFSLLFALLNEKEVISNTASNVCIYGFSILFFFLFSFIVGKKIKKRGLLIGTALSLLYVIFAFVLRSFHLTPVSLTSNIFLFIRIITLFLGAVAGVNIGQKKNH